MDKPTRTCSIKGCDRRHKGHGYCDMHYQKFKKYGDPNAGRRRYMSSEEAFAARTEWRGDCLIWTGGTIGDGYGTLAHSGRVVLAHRYAWEREHGPIEDGVMIDHRYHCDRRCVNVSHLREASRAENRQNLSGPHSNSSSGYRNVHRAGNKWAVCIKKDGKDHYFGYYDTVEEAVPVAERARREMFGEFAGKG